jgi:hypothetical protein
VFVKTKLFPVIVISSTVALLLSGCASYHAASLNGLSSEVFTQSSTSASKAGIVIAAKALNKLECKRYFDRDVLKKGYQPVQLYIQNNSDMSYSFSLNRISLPCARSEEVAEKVHTSTIGRILGYGIPGLIIAWPLVIPAVVDGIKSSEANELLDNDFASKTARDQIILPHSCLNKIVFVPIAEYQPSFTITIMDQESNQPKNFNVTAQG